MNNINELNEKDNLILNIGLKELITLEGLAATYFNVYKKENNITIECTCLTESENPIDEKFLVNYISIMEYFKNNLSTKFNYTLASFKHFVELTENDDKKTTNDINNMIMVYSKNKQFNNISQDIKTRKLNKK